MGASSSSQAHGKSPLACIRRKDAQGIRGIDIMVNHVTITLMFISGPRWERMHSKFDWMKSNFSEK